jgi:hypothetical protein
MTIVNIYDAKTRLSKLKDKIKVPSGFDTPLPSDVVEII